MSYICEGETRLYNLKIRKKISTLREFLNRSHISAEQRARAEQELESAQQELARILNQSNINAEQRAHAEQELESAQQELASVVAVSKD